jgi:hypothetical protein
MKKFLMPLLLIGVCLPPLAAFSQSIISNKGGGRPDLTKRPPQKLDPREIKANLNNIRSQQSLVFQSQIRLNSLHSLNTKQKTESVPCCFVTSSNGVVSAMMPLPYSAISIETFTTPKAFESKFQGLAFITASKVYASQTLVFDYGSMLSQSIVDSMVSIQPPAQPSAEQSQTDMTSN